jgi:hypothetical protein
MHQHEPRELQELLDQATPFLAITAVEQCRWCRVMEDPKDPRCGPWSYRAVSSVTSLSTWNRLGEVLYFVRDSIGRLRLVGQSKDRLKTRWRESPMFHADTKQALGRHALFHSSTWPAIEKALKAGEAPPFTVSAIFRPDLQEACARIGGTLRPLLELPETRLHRLSYHVETWICSLSRGRLNLWNKQKV